MIATSQLLPRLCQSLVTVLGSLWYWKLNDEKDLRFPLFLFSLLAQLPSLTKNAANMTACVANHSTGGDYHLFLAFDADFFYP